MENKFAVSVIMPVYNTKKYLEEAIESIINQTIGFKENIQIILINDASSDQSDLLCEKFKAQYPENIEYVFLRENRGASFCRNMGLELISGKYVAFADSDDKWSANAFERGVQLIEQNSEEIDLVSINLEYFDAFEKPHILNTDNLSDIIVDINHNYSRIRTTVPCFIKSEIAKQYRFNENQLFREDTAYINSIILRQQRFGMLASDVIYYYRRRSDDTSIVQVCSQDKRYYLNAPKQLYDTLYMESMKNCGKFVPMMQFVIAYDTVVRFTEQVNGLSDEELGIYYEILYNNMQCVKDELFLEVNYSDIPTKKLIIAYKHNKELGEFLIRDKKKDMMLGEYWVYLQRSRCNYQMVKKMIQLKQHGKLLKDYFILNGYHNIAIYGFADLGKLLYEELRNTEITVDYLIDRNAGKIFSELLIVTPEGEMEKVDVIVVTAVYYYAEIKEMLCRKNSIPIVSLEEVLGEAYH